MMIRGTTPTNTFVSCTDLSEATIVEAYFTYSQNDEVIFEKSMPAITIDGKRISVKLTQADTLLLDDDEDVEIQAALKFSDGTVIRSKVVRTDVGMILKDEAI